MSNVYPPFININPKMTGIYDILNMTVKVDKPCVSTNPLLAYPTSYKQ